jgi:hypothetical protein
MLALLLAALAAQPVDEALRTVETEQARAKGQQEKGLEAIERVLKSTPRRCPEPEPCAPCAELELVEQLAPLPAPAPVVRVGVPPWAVAVSAAAGAFLGVALTMAVTR